WSRCGLRPRLHLGVRRDDEAQHEAHAWVTVEHSPATGASAAHVLAIGADDFTAATSAHGYPEAFVL
ncbi:MAG TPA: lasso peptide biosynthesis protein, partial [Thermoanaerobaculia bacterium]|nr:lasso peptide biosynthesis protein [Thermoanaerobaculia bacterium]